MVALWVAIVWLAVITWLVLDGRTLGMGALRLFVAESPDERREVLDAIGPMWSWYEVWLVAAGGVLLLAFPAVLAAAFSGYYLALFLIAWLLVLRGIAIELARHLDQPLWLSFWDLVLAWSSALTILVLGVALGNVVRGVPIDESGEFPMAFFTDFRTSGHVGLLDWYSLLIGALNLAAFGAHGTNYLTSQCNGAVRERSRVAGRLLWSATAILGVAVAVATWVVRPDLWAELWSRPLAILLLLAAAGGLVAIVAGYRSGRYPMAFVGSCALIAGLLGARAAASFPILLYSTLDPERSVSAYAAASRHDSLVIALVWWLIAAPLALVWHALASRSFRGRLGHGPLPPG